MREEKVCKRKRTRNWLYWCVVLFTWYDSCK